MNHNNPEQIARVMTSCVASQVSAALAPAQVPADYNPIDNAAELRRAYELAFSTPDLTKEILLSVGYAVVEQLKKTIPELKDQKEQKVDFSEYAIFHSAKGLAIGDKPVVAIGRMFSDIAFPEADTNCSRLHALVFPLPVYGVVAVVDVGSYTGIITTKRSSDAKCESSTPVSRRALIFKLDESAALLMGNQQVLLNPKLCCVCFEAPRNQKFNCGHQCTCKSCADKLELCPLCRAPIKEKKEVLLPIPSKALTTDVKG